jgi:fatty-acyl-CoA synthase
MLFVSNNDTKQRKRGDAMKTLGSPSHVAGLSSQALLEVTISNALDRAAETWPDQLAVIVREQGVRLSYTELRDRAEAVAKGFIALGLVPGDRIGIWGPNSTEWILTQFGAAKAGLILVSLNPAYRRSEIEYALRKVGCRAIVCATSHRTSRYPDILAEIAPELGSSAPGKLRAQALPDLEIVIQIGGPTVAGAVPFEALPVSPYHDGIMLDDVTARVAACDPTNIQFTSGTTGAPKGATLTHRNILNNGFFVGEELGLGIRDKICVPVPFYHCFGMVMGNLACVTHGSAIVVPGAAFEAGTVLSAIQEERCTAIYGVPTMFIALLDHPDFESFDLGSLRTGIMAGAPCPTDVMRRVVDRLWVREITIAYGMTETSPVSFQTSRSDTLERRVSTVGRVHPHVEVKIIDEAGHTVSRGTPGELCTRGYSVMRGYWNDEERTAEAIDAAGWMHTGDLATIDDEDYCNIVGRIKDMVIRGGENVYPREIEEYLHTHPDVQDVQVFGVPDPRFGEELCAWVRLRSAPPPGGGYTRLLPRQDRALQGAAIRAVRRRLPHDRHGQGPEIRHARADAGRTCVD